MLNDWLALPQTQFMLAHWWKILLLMAPLITSPLWLPQLEMWRWRRKNR